MVKTYSATDIQVLEGLDAVRMRPGMYIGSTGPRGLHHLIWEIVDNAIDEASNGYATEITVALKKDGSCEVTDNGRGIPVDIHPQLGVSGVEVVYTQLHAGGKFNDKNYAYSGGLHGVGASVVNALSEWVTVDVYRDYSHYQIRFESIEDKKTGKIISGRPVAPLAKVGNTRKRGTQVCFSLIHACLKTRASMAIPCAAVCANWPISTRACALCSSTSAKRTKSAAAANTAMRAVWPISCAI